MFHFTPLLGAHASSRASQSLLEFEGGIKILVDLGWEASGPSGFDVGRLRELERHVPTLSLVLLTHATTAHLGAFAHACKHFPLFRQVPIYATTPVISLGQTLLQDVYASAPAAAGVVPDDALGEAAYMAGSGNGGVGDGDGDERPQILYQAPTADEIRSYFALINDLKYSQPHQPLPSPFSPPLNGLTITAYSAGHTPGGTIWHVQHGMESVVYSVDWNLTRENALGGAAWLGGGLTGGGSGGAEVVEQLRKPTALVCSARGAERNPLTRQRRDEQLLDMLRAAVEREGTVLIPSDSGARALEMAYTLEKACAAEAADGALRRARLYLAGKSMGATVRYAKSMLEWMNESVVQEFESRDLAKVKDGQQADKTPFDFRFVKIVEKRNRLDKILNQQSTGPRIILASDESLSWGFSRDVLEAIAGNSNNTVILTEEYTLRADLGDGQSSIGRTLWDWYHERKDGVAVEQGSNGQTIEQVFNDNRDLPLDDATLQPLEGRELAIYQNFLATQRQLQNTMQSNGATGLETSGDVDEASDDSSSSSEDSENEQQGKVLNVSAQMNQANKSKGAGPKEAIGVNALIREPNFYDWDVRGKKGREAMFPFPQKRRRIDDYGEVIKPEDYLRAEERDEVDGHDMRDGGGEDPALGQKRKWDDAVAAGGGATGAQAGSKRRKGNKLLSAEKGAASDSGYATGEGNAESEDSESDDEYDPEDSGPAMPSKLVRSSRSIKANLRIGYVDFSGLHDQRSLTMLIPLINPRKLILVGGTDGETAWLADECARKMELQLPHIEGNEAADILLPQNNSMVVASMDTHAWTVRLSRALTRRLQWQNVRGLGIVTLTGRLEPGKPPEEQAAKPEDPDVPARKRQKLVKNEEEEGGGGSEAPKAEDTSGAEKPPDGDIPEIGAAATTTAAAAAAKDNLAPVLDVVPAPLAAATRTFARPLHVGDLRLADLRKLLSAAGHKAEFRGEGTLVVDGIVAVRKTTGGRIEVEGGDGVGRPLVPTAASGGGGIFWEVRRRIYDGLAVIAGGG